MGTSKVLEIIQVSKDSFYHSKQLFMKNINSRALLGETRNSGLNVGISLKASLYMSISYQTCRDDEGGYKSER